MLHKLLAAALLFSSVVVGQGCYAPDSANFPWLNNYISASGSTSNWDQICTSCSPFSDCLVPIPKVRWYGNGVIGGYLVPNGKHEEAVGLSTDSCSTDTPLACVSTVCVGYLVLDTIVDYTISANDTGTVPCRVRVDNTSISMTSVLYVGVGNQWEGPQINIPNQSQWIGVNVYFQNFMLFTWQGTSRMMCSQATYCTIHS